MLLTGLDADIVQILALQSYRVVHGIRTNLIFDFTKWSWNYFLLPVRNWTVSTSTMEKRSEIKRMLGPNISFSSHTCISNSCHCFPTMVFPYVYPWIHGGFTLDPSWIHSGCTMDLAISERVNPKTNMSGPFCVSAFDIQRCRPKGGYCI